MWAFLFVSIACFSFVALRMKRRIPAHELYTTVVFALFADVITDLYASFVFHAWGLFYVAEVEFASLLVIFGLYLPSAAMIVNWYPFGSSWRKRLGYLLAWSAFSTVYEWATLQFGIVWHDRWNLFYSFLLYPFIYYMLIAQLRGYRWMKRTFDDAGGGGGSCPPLA